MNNVTYSVKCPKCSGEATANMHPVGTNGTYREVFSRMGAKRIVCNACGFCQEVRNDRAGDFELWYAADFKGHRLWAVNGKHLAFLISWFAGEITEKDLSFADRAMVEAFPKWMIMAKNRPDLLNCLRRMRDRNTNHFLRRKETSRR